MIFLIVILFSCAFSYAAQQPESPIVKAPSAQVLGKWEDLPEQTALEYQAKVSAFIRAIRQEKVKEVRQAWEGGIKDYISAWPWRDGSDPWRSVLRQLSKKCDFYFHEDPDLYNAINNESKERARAPRMVWKYSKVDRDTIFVLESFRYHKPICLY